METDSLQLLLRPISREFSMELTQALARANADEETQARYDYLADGRTEGRLTEEETEELASIIRANSVLSALKAEAIERLELGKQ